MGETMLDEYQELAVRVLSKIAADPSLIRKLIEHMGAIPNVPSATIGGSMFWNTVVSIGGWRLQHNWYFDNYRIIDPEDIPHIWSKETTLIKAFQSLENPDE